MTKSPKSIKLTYFNGQGRAEHIRLLLAYGGSKYEDKRIEFADWPKLKAETPWGSLPFITVDGKDIGQSMAISRYVANLHGITGKTPVEQAFLDSIVDSCTDMREGHIKAVFAAEPEKAEQKKKFEESVPGALKNLQAQLDKTGSKFFGGNEISWADIHLYSVSETLGSAMEPEFAKCKGLSNIIKAVGDSPNIKAYVTKRPATDF